MNKHTQMSGKPANGMRVARLAAVLIAGLALTACDLFGGGDSSGPACQENNTADVSFKNTSGGIANMYVHWDGIDITGTIVDGATSAVTTVSAIPHFMVFRISGGVTLACTGSYVTPAQCGSTVYSCGG
jgi:hypothetical protein